MTRDNNRSREALCLRARNPMGKAERPGPHTGTTKPVADTRQTQEACPSRLPSARPKVVYMGRPPETEDKGTRGGAGGGVEVGV